MKLAEGLILYSLDDNFILIADENHQHLLHGIVSLNETAYDIIKQLDSGKSIRETAEYLTKNYSDITSEKALREVQRIVQQLEKNHLLENI